LSLDRYWLRGELRLAARLDAHQPEVVAVQSFGLLRSVARIGSGGAVAAALLVAAPATAADTSEGTRAPEPVTVPTGVIYGGATSQRFPIVIEVSSDGGQVVHATVAIRLRCTSGGVAVIPDSFDQLAVSKSGRFRNSFGPQVTRNADGTTTDLEGKIAGAFNATGRRASGTWQFKATTHDAAGAVSDTCDSGSIGWRVKQ
jgi:hypothetical protein